MSNVSITQFYKSDLHCISNTYLNIITENKNEAGCQKQNNKNDAKCWNCNTSQYSNHKLGKKKKHWKIKLSKIFFE